MSSTKSYLYSKIKSEIESLDLNSISEERKKVLESLITFIQNKYNKDEDIRLNFICTHNSRRSHLSQIWSQTLAKYFSIKNVFSYSGGTEATALFPVVSETLKKSGFDISIIAKGLNPIYSIKYSSNEHPIIGFSKTYNDAFNPQSEFAAILTCNHADENCPNIVGAEQRIPLTYIDPKVSDNTPLQQETYYKRSIQIATEMKYIFSNIKK